MITQIQKLPSFEIGSHVVADNGTEFVVTAIIQTMILNNDKPSIAFEIVCSEIKSGTDN